MQHNKIHLNFNLITNLSIYLLMALLLTGCTWGAQAPDFLLFNSYFPSWLVGTLFALPVTVFIRFLFIKTGIDDYLPLRFFVYVGFWLILTMAFWYFYSPR